MHSGKKLNIAFMGARNSACTGILSLLAQGHNITAAVSYDSELTGLIEKFNIRVFSTVKDKKFIEYLKISDLLLSIHGREVVDENILNIPRLGAVNLHPFLYKYKGKEPVRRALEEENYKASVGAHVMTKDLDCGQVLVEEFKDVSGAKSVEEVYNRLYPLYSLVTLKAIEALTGKVSL
ncbi:MAG: hypothetical protein JW867_00785 [Candidatus Omnitrophica bacterium]|nr:hypothetical protein [Candidatus Omnitrophota bacterium]